jgi:hypothetical protein
MNKPGLIHLAALLGLLGAGCATPDRWSPEAVAAHSPRAEVMRPLDALRLAERYVDGHPGTDFLVGSGDSMLPLYRDGTVIVTRRLGSSRLRSGMTVAYLGADGRPVAHVLVRRSYEGWLTMGVGNPACDGVRVTGENLLGVVVRAFEPVRSPLAVLVDEAGSRAVAGP